MFTSNLTFRIGEQVCTVNNTLIIKILLYFNFRLIFNPMSMIVYFFYH